MASSTIPAWLALEENNFTDINEWVIRRLEEAQFRAIHETLRRGVEKSGEKKLEMPWGTYTAKAVSAGEGTNINVKFEASNRFKKLLNEDSENANLRQDTFDPEFTKLYADFVAYGTFNEDEFENIPQAKRGLRVDDPEITFYLNDYMTVMANLAKEHRRQGKLYCLEITEPCPHGRFDFEYGDEIKVSFTPHKLFKQTLKNDSAASLLDNSPDELAEVSQKFIPIPRHLTPRPDGKFKVPRQLVAV